MNEIQTIYLMVFLKRPNLQFHNCSSCRQNKNNLQPPQAILSSLWWMFEKDVENPGICQKVSARQGVENLGGGNSVPSSPARVTSKHSFTAAGVIALPFKEASSIHHRWLCCRYTWRHITLAGQWPICSTISTMIAPSSFSSSLSSDQQTRLGQMVNGLLLLSAMAWPQCPQLCLLIKTHQLLSLAPPSIQIHTKPYNSLPISGKHTKVATRW